jgi:hypothetical protein
MHKHSLLRLAALLFLAACAGTAAARGGHGYGGHGYGGHSHANIGFYFNDPFYWGVDPFFYPYRPYYYNPPPVIIEQRDPPVYIQRQPAAPATSSAWYYCQNPAGYYPYVQSCSQPWVSVDPRSVPPAPPR